MTDSETLERNACTIAAGFIAAYGGEWTDGECDTREAAIVRVSIKMAMAIRRELTKAQMPVRDLPINRRVNAVNRMIDRKKEQQRNDAVSR